MLGRRDRFITANGNKLVCWSGEKFTPEVIRVYDSDIVRIKQNRSFVWVLTRDGSLFCERTLYLKEVFDFDVCGNNIYVITTDHNLLLNKEDTGITAWEVFTGINEITTKTPTHCTTYSKDLFFKQDIPRVEKVYYTPKGIKIVKDMLGNWFIGDVFTTICAGVYVGISTYYFWPPDNRDEEFAVTEDELFIARKDEQFIRFYHQETKELISTYEFNRY